MLTIIIQSLVKILIIAFLTDTITYYVKSIFTRKRRTIKVLSIVETTKRY
jgi:hypothetical protein